MSRKNNVNPDHYKVAGRERPSALVEKGSTRNDPKVRALPGERVTAKKK